MTWPLVSLPLVRQPSADRALVAWAESRVGSRFEWSVCDCSMLAFEALAILSGRTVAELRTGLPAYDTAPRAARALSIVGGMRRVFTKLGLVEVPLGYAHTGDIVFDEQSAGVLVGGSILCIDDTTPGAVVTLAKLAHWHTNILEETALRLEARA